MFWSCFVFTLKKFINKNKMKKKELKQEKRKKTRKKLKNETKVKQNIYPKKVSSIITPSIPCSCVYLSIFGLRSTPIDKCGWFLFVRTKLWTARTCCANRPCRCSVFLVCVCIDTRIAWLFFLLSLDLLPWLADSMKKRKHFICIYAAMHRKTAPKWPLRWNVTSEWYSSMYRLSVPKEYSR